MTREEIETAYAGAFIDDAFEAFDAAGVGIATVDIVLGQEVAKEYADWIYTNLK